MRKPTVSIFHALKSSFSNINRHGSNGGHQPRDHRGHKMTENTILKLRFLLKEVFTSNQEPLTKFFIICKIHNLLCGIEYLHLF